MGFNPCSGTEDPRREDFDIYIGHPQNVELLLEAKMDWQSGITGRAFIEEKTLRNTKASKFIVGRLVLDVFDTERLREMYEEKLPSAVWDERAATWLFYRYKHVVGGDQPNNMGMLLDWKTCRENSVPFWQFVKQLNQRQ